MLGALKSKTLAKFMGISHLLSSYQTLPLNSAQILEDFLKVLNFTLTQISHLLVIH